MPQHSLSSFCSTARLCNHNEISFPILSRLNTFFALWQRSKKKGGFATLDVFSAAGAASHFALRFERQLHFAHLNIINVFFPPLPPKNTHTISFASLIASTTCLWSNERCPDKAKTPFDLPLTALYVLFFARQESGRRDCRRRAGKGPWQNTRLTRLEPDS